MSATALLDDDDGGQPPSVEYYCRHYVPRIYACDTCVSPCACGHRCEEHAETDSLSGKCSPDDGNACACLEYARVIALGAST